MIDFKTKDQLLSEIAKEADKKAGASKLFDDGAFEDYCADYVTNIHHALNTLVRLNYTRIVVAGPIHFPNEKTPLHIQNFHEVLIKSLVKCGWEAELCFNQIIIKG